MKLLWTDNAWDEYRDWQLSNPVMIKRINALIDDMMRSPFRGLGKPEPLRNELTGWWSRRITEEHRLVYRCVGKGDEQRIEIAYCRDHY